VVFGCWVLQVQILSSNPFQIVMPACLSSSFVLNGYSQFRLALVLPAAGMLIIGVFYTVKSFFTEGESAYCHRHTCTSSGCTNQKASKKKHCGGQECRGVQDGVEPAGDNVCRFESGAKSCSTPRMVAGIRLLRAVCVSSAALLYFLLYPTITVNAVRILSECQTLCTDLAMSNCTSYMRSDYSIDCGTGTHTGYFAVAAVVFATIAIGTPALLATMLWKHRSAFLKQSVDSLYYDPLSTPSALVLGFGFFFKPFKSSLIFWEAVELAYKLSLTSIITFVAPGTSLQVYTGVVIAGFFWMVDAVHQPFENRAENALQTYAQGVIFLTLAIGGMLQTGASDSASATYKTARVNEDAAGAVLILINASVFAAVVALAWLNRPKGVIETIRRTASFRASADGSGAVASAAPQSSGGTVHPVPSASNAGKEQPPAQPPVKETAFTAVGAGGMGVTCTSAVDSTDDEAEGVGFGDGEPDAPGGYLSVGAGAAADEVVVGEAPGAAF